MSDNILTQERLKELLSYDPETGVFVRIKTTSKKIKIGAVAGTLHPSGYRYIKINRKQFREHRLAWLYITGEFPPNEIDHINRIKNDNRFVNLRAATHSENAHNQGINCVNTSGYKGVYYHKRDKQWRAKIKLNNVSTYLGSFLTPEEASGAYLAAQRIYHPSCPSL